MVSDGKGVAIWVKCNGSIVDNWGMCAAPQRLTVRYFGDAKARGELIPMVTAYDYNHGLLVDSAGIPAILVGDSLGNVVLGYDSTVPVTVEDMVRATAAVTRGAKKAFVVADMPFGSYQSDVPTAIKNAARLMKEGGAQSVKLEGGVSVEETIRALVEAGIPVMGHVGFTPQSIHSFGGYRVQGRGENAERVIEDALAVERAGAYSIVLELMPSELSKEITGQFGYSDDWDRCGSALRWSDTGVARHAGVGPDVQAASCGSVWRFGGGDSGCGEAVCG